MAITVDEVIREVQAVAPPALALEGDPTGLQVGSASRLVDRVLVTLDLTLEVAREAAAIGAALVVSHHAVVFRPLHDLRTDRPRGRVLAALLSAETAVYVPHTALDVAPGGSNDRLAAKLGLTDVAPLDATGIGRLGRTARVALDALAARARAALGARSVRMVGDAGRQVERVALVAGDGRRYIERAASLGADVLVTGDVDHHAALDARARGLALIDVGHHASESLVRELLVELLAPRLAPRGVTVVASRVDTDPFLPL